MRKKILAVAATLLAGWAMPAPAKEPIKVGAILAVTGPASFLGAPDARTLEMLTEELNAKGGVGAKKIEVIKVIRQLTNLGLKEAKDLAETPNAKVLDLVAKDAAEDAKKKLTDVGATVEVK